MAIKRHIQHQRTSSLEYVRILKANIPVNENVTVMDYKPKPEEIREMNPKPKYIFVTNAYYMLKGKQANTETLEYGEISISFNTGNEALVIKNSNNELIEFKPSAVYRNNYITPLADKNSVNKVQIYNPALTTVNGTCTWKIPYTEIVNAHISYDGAVVFLREIGTGKQLVPDVTFNSDNITILIDSLSNISQRKYLAIIIGTGYTAE